MAPWQLNLEMGSSIGGQQAQGRVMNAGDLARDGEAEARPFRVPGHEGLEQALADLRRHAGAIIAHGDHEVLAAPRCTELHSAPGWRMPQSIADEVLDDSANFARIEGGR